MSFFTIINGSKFKTTAFPQECLLRHWVRLKKIIFQSNSPLFSQGEDSSPKTLAQLKFWALLESNGFK